MNYLDPTEYEAFGLEATTAAAWVSAASSVIDAHCRRPTLSVTQYVERMRIAEGRNTVRLTYTPLTSVAPASTPIVSARGRYAMPRRGEWPIDELSRDVARMFGLPGVWSAIDSLDIDVYAATGELSLPLNTLGLGFSEIEVTYTAGFDLFPDGVKTACAQIVRNAQATPALNVSDGRLDRMRLRYFSGSLLDQTSRSLLSQYVAQKVG
jgi:hypothetical protein